MKYHPRDREVEAVQFTGTNFKEVSEFTGGQVERRGAYALRVRTPYGFALVGRNHFVIKDHNGDLWARSTSHFEEEYEPVS